MNLPSDMLGGLPAAAYVVITGALAIVLGAALLALHPRWRRWRLAAAAKVAPTHGAVPDPAWTMDGVWTQSIPRHKEDRHLVPPKEDEVRCRQDGDFVRGEIVRKVGPTDELGYTWGFHGTIEGRALFCVYWPTNAAGPRGSYGAIMLKKVDENLWRGRYVKVVHMGDDPDRGWDELKDVRLSWKLKSRGPESGSGT